MSSTAISAKNHYKKWAIYGALSWHLTKFPISAASTLTLASGYIAYRHRFDLGLLTASLGTLLMAMASSAMNEVQERKLDALMERTKHRPLPQEALTSGQAVGASVALGTIGFLFLFRFHGLAPASLGLLAALWYNAVYTPLKRVSAFAVVPGSLIGVLPPAIGWTAAGADLTGAAIFALCFFMFVWQVPHFWLLSVHHQSDYTKAGFPTLGAHFQRPQILRLIFTWICATVAAAVQLPAFGLASSIGAVVLLVCGGVLLVVRSVSLLLAPEGSSCVRRSFLDINRFAVLVLATVVLDALGPR